MNYYSVSRILLVIFGILVSCMFTAIAVWHMDWQEVFVALSPAGIYPWFFFSIVSYSIGLIFRGLRTRMLISRDANLSILTATNIVVVGYAANNILPVRIGEFVRAGMMSERTGIPFVQSLTVVFIERIFDGLAIALLLSAAVLALGIGGNVQHTILISWFVFGGALVLIFFVALAPHRFMAGISKLIYALNPGLHDTAVRFASFVANGARYINSSVNIFKIGALSLVIWLCDVGLFMCLLPAFGHSFNLWQAMFVMGVANLGIALPIGFGFSSPGYIGPFHYKCIQSLVLLGVAQAAALSFAVVAHLAIYITLMVWGGIVLLWYGVMVGLTFNLTKRARNIFGRQFQTPVTANVLGLTSSDAVTIPTSPFIYKLSEAVVPLDVCGRISEPRTVVMYVADFMQGEIMSLSKKFKLLFAIGMFGFNSIVWLRYFKPFTALPLTTRVAIFNSWAYSRIPLQRQLFKLIRSTALLAFYEHPAVIAALEHQRAPQ